MSYLQSYGSRAIETPQTEAIPQSGQVPNAGGGFGWHVDARTQLDRFLILGTEGGTYYAKERELTKANLTAVFEMIKQDPTYTIGRILQISEGGRAMKNDPALLSLALCVARGDVKARKYALAALPRVARTGGDLLRFMGFLRGNYGSSPRMVRKAISAWYQNRPAKDTAFQVLKYQTRDGFSHRDVLKLLHMKGKDQTFQDLFHYVYKGWEDIGPDPHPDEALRQIWAFERLKLATDEAEILRLIEAYRLPLEMVPPEKRTPRVWQTVLPNLGLTALIRNLGNLGKTGILKKGAWDVIKTVSTRITDEKAIQKARIHPIKVMAALLTYSSGKGFLGSGEWSVVSDIVDALGEAFYKAFQNVEVTGLRYLIGLDVSGSMTQGEVGGVPNLSPRVAACAMSMVPWRIEEKVECMAFSQGFIPVSFTRKSTLQDVVKATSAMPYSRTDCSLPMQYALENQIPVDMFMILTDNETNTGRQHPAQALIQYRRKMEIPAKLAVVAMTSSHFSIADPRDSGMCDFIGFDTNTPAAVGQFAVLGREKNFLEESKNPLPDSE